MLGGAPKPEPNQSQKTGNELQKVILEGEVMTAEEERAFKDFNSLFYTPLGKLNVDKTTEALQRLEDLGVKVDLPTQAQTRIQQELKYLLRWRPKADADDPSSLWVSMSRPEAGAVMTEEDRAMRAHIGRAVMGALASSIPPRVDQESLRKFIELVQKTGLSIDNEETELRWAVAGVLSSREYNRGFGSGLKDFMDLVDSLGIRVSPRTLGHAIRNEIGYILDNSRGIDEEDLKKVETFIEFAKEKGCTLRFDDDLFKMQIVNGILGLGKYVSIDELQKIFDFCAKHSIPIDVKEQQAGSRESISSQLRDMAHDARVDLDLGKLEEVVAFAERNNITLEVPSSAIERWRREIPEYIEKRNQRNK